MRYLATLASLALCLLAWSSLAPAHPTAAQVSPTASPTATPIPTPQLDLAWEPGGLRVTWDAWIPVCLTLVGNLPPQLADLPCSRQGSVLLPTGGVSQAYAPQRRTHIEVRDQADLRYVVAGRAIPARYEVWLPMVASR